MATQGDYAVSAASVIETLFPPKNQTSVYHIVVSLNLLNAVVKQEKGREVTGYAYIKGMVACLFLWLLYHPMEGVQIYWDEKDQITYFRVNGCQFSFHYVPLLYRFAKEMDKAGLKVQQWDGRRLQTVAVELFHDAVGGLPDLDEYTRQALVERMVGFGRTQLKERVHAIGGVRLDLRKLRKECRQRISNADGHLRATQPTDYWSSMKGDKWHCLQLALKFNAQHMGNFELRRYGDTWKAKVAYYTGSNYGSVTESLIGNKPYAFPKPERFLEKGQYYYVRRHDWAWKKMTYGRFLLLKAHYNFLKLGDRYFNLCVTYGIARYLALAYPQLRFINILNYTRFKVRRHIYTYRDLQCVPLRSKARTLKVWMVVDRYHVLRHFDIEDLPATLFAEYEASEDYCSFFQREYGVGGVGLLAYNRFHLLPTVYVRIVIRGHYAWVMNRLRKWAVYSLFKEQFETDFVYDSIWYDSQYFAILGRRNNTVEWIHKLPVMRNLIRNLVVRE